MDTAIQQFAERLEYLYDRWQDEKGYEDFKDYVADAAKHVPKGCTFISLTGDPFKATFDVPVNHKRTERTVIETDDHFTKMYLIK